jgi:hypothetical protein
VSVRTVDAFPSSDAEVAPFVRDLGLDGLVDIHTHALPERLQRAVWDYFDGLDSPPWPVTYRSGLTERLGTLRDLGVDRHTALAYAHRPGMLRWLNDFTLGLAEEHAQVVPTFTLFPEPDVTAEVARCLAAGGQVVKVHLQVGRFHATEPLLDEAWGLLAAARTPIVVHASAVYGVDGGEAYCGADGLRALLDRHPGLRLVVAHLGMPTYDEFLDLAEEHPELRMDTAMVLTDPAYGEDARRAEDRIDRLRGIADRLLFGSDFPTIPHRYAAQVRGLAMLGLDDASLRWLLHDHAAGLLAGVRPV